MKPRQQACSLSTVPIPSSTGLKDKREHVHNDALFLSFQEKGIYFPKGRKHHDYISKRQKGLQEW